jgi:hypothetical protein
MHVLVRHIRAGAYFITQSMPPLTLSANVVRFFEVAAEVAVFLPMLPYYLFQSFVRLIFTSNRDITQNCYYDGCLPSLVINLPEYTVLVVLFLHQYPIDSQDTHSMDSSCRSPECNTNEYTTCLNPVVLIVSKKLCHETVTRGQTQQA